MVTSLHQIKFFQFLVQIQNDKWSANQIILGIAATTKILSRSNKILSISFWYLPLKVVKLFSQLSVAPALRFLQRNLHRHSRHGPGFLGAIVPCVGVVTRSSAELAAVSPENRTNHGSVTEAKHVTGKAKMDSHDIIYP